jgi:hypothetical protein
MDVQEALGDRNRLTTAVVTAALAVIAIQSLRKGKRLRGLVAGLAAVAIGVITATSTGDVTQVLDREDESATNETERSRDSVELRCAECGEPIVPGQARTPNEDHETVHKACLETPA